ncbi:MAG TPA: gamma-glutamylcyclotransferase [Geminicoccaceae bacterium]|nr:gamma-glutamylcyclotransferase [Geminicoccaceae bacterium]
MVLTRESLRDGWLQRLVAASPIGVKVLSEEELRRSRAAILASHPPGEDLWLFGYGSLIWNPAFHFEERRLARLHGYHRQFCLWTHAGRGTAERPGLMLGLERGGSCPGVAFRVAHDAIESELDLVWRREMVTGAYRPRWVRVRTDRGSVRAVAFVINRAYERYAGPPDDLRIVEAVALAEGPLGACRDYLFNTAAHLEELGIKDRGLARLVREVQAFRRGLDPETP